MIIKYIDTTKIQLTGISNNFIGVCNDEDTIYYMTYNTDTKCHEIYRHRKYMKSVLLCYFVNTQPHNIKFKYNLCGQPELVQHKDDRIIISNIETNRITHELANFNHDHIVIVSENYIETYTARTYHLYDISDPTTDLFNGICREIETFIYNDNKFYYSSLLPNSIVVIHMFNISTRVSSKLFEIVDTGNKYWKHSMNILDDILYVMGSTPIFMCYDIKTGRRFTEKHAGFNNGEKFLINKKRNKMYSFGFSGQLKEYEILRGTLFKSIDSLAYYDTIINTRDE